MKQRKNLNANNPGDGILVYSYCRVSSKRQEEEGYSLDTQEGTIRDYAKDKGFTIEERFRESYSASSSGRRGFDGMLSAFNNSRAQRKIVLVGKVDRFTRNHQDALAVEELGIEVHFVYENMVISCQSSPGELLLYDIQTAIATYQSRVTGADTKRNMRRKAEEGLWPSRAPFGYKNVTRNKVKVIIPDENELRLFKLLHKEACRGDHTLSSLTREAIQIGFQFSTGTKITASWIRRLIENPIYSGDFFWKGIKYTGVHEPLISREEYHHAVEKLGLKSSTAVSTRQAEKFLYWGMLYCPECMHSVCGERKKGIYTYYRCGAKPSVRMCNNGYSREEVIDQQFTWALRCLKFPDDAVSWISEIMQIQNEFEKAESRRTEASHNDQIRRLKLKQSKLLDQHLEGCIDDDLFATKNDELKKAICALVVEEDNESISAVVNVSSILDTLPAIFSALPVQKKRKFLELVFIRSPFAGAVYPRFNKSFNFFDTRNNDPFK